MDLSSLLQAKGPWLHLLAAKPSDFCNEVWGLEQSAPVRAVARIIRGRKGGTVGAFFDEAAAALQFPFYFGENWDSFNDCMQDLTWLRAEAFTLCFADANHLLGNAPAEQRQRLITVLNQAIQRSNQTSKSRPARPFHVVFHATPGEEATLVTRWQAAGASLNRLG